jgi:hypothetical protein
MTSEQYCRDPMSWAALHLQVGSGVPGSGVQRLAPELFDAEADDFGAELDGMHYDQTARRHSGGSGGSSQGGSGGSASPYSDDSDHAYSPPAAAPRVAPAAVPGKVGALLRDSASLRRHAAAVLAGPDG